MKLSGLLNKNVLFLKMKHFFGLVKKKKKKKEVESSDKTCTRSIPANFAYGYFPVIPDDEYSNEQLSRSVFPRCTCARSHTAAR